MVSEEIETYLKSLIPSRGQQVERIESYAKKHDVPIMDLVGMECLLQQLKIIGPSKILEIGSAIGYSAIRMALALPNSRIVTIERDEERYREACLNVKKLNLEEQIELKFGDALELAETLELTQDFDVLFIDAAKGQYERFFHLYGELIKPGGVILSDNVLFRGLVAQEEIETGRLRSLTKKIKNYNEWLMNHPDYETRIFPVGDGLAVSIKR